MARAADNLVINMSQSSSKSVENNGLSNIIPDATNATALNGGRRRLAVTICSKLQS